MVAWPLEEFVLRFGSGDIRLCSFKICSHVGVISVSPKRERDQKKILRGQRMRMSEDEEEEMMF